MFRKITKELEQNLSIICLDSIKFLSLFWKMNQNMISVTPSKTVIAVFHISKFGCCKPTTLQKKTRFFFFGTWFLPYGILNKEVKQVLQGTGWRNRSCNGTSKENKVSH